MAAAHPTPSVVDDRPVTWWELLPPHRPATPTELAATLRTLHQLPAPTDLELPAFDPLDGIAHSINNARELSTDDRTWLQQHLDNLRDQYANLPHGRPHGLIHGDAWQGNIGVPTSGPTAGVPILLDLEHVTLGPPEWDLAAFTADHTDFARITTTDYHAFTTTHGYDLTIWPGYRTLADIQELRWLAFILTKTTTTPAALTEAQHRINCLRRHIPRPWT